MLNLIINIIVNLKGHRLNSGSDSRPIIGSDFGANSPSQYRPAIIIQTSIDHWSNFDSQHWLPTLRAGVDHRPIIFSYMGDLFFYLFFKYYIVIAISNEDDSDNNNNNTIINSCYCNYKCRYASMLF